MTISVKDSGGSDVTVDTINDLISYGPALEAGGNLATIAGAISSSKMATKAASGDFADGAVATIGAKADTAVTATDTTPGSVVALLKGVISKLAGTLTVATHAVTQSGTWNITNVSGTVSLPTGASTSANQTATQGTTGSAVPSKGMLVQGSDGTDARNLATTTGGILKVQLNDGTTAFPILAGSSGAPATTVPAIAVSVRDANGNGQATMSASAPVAIASDQSDLTVKPTITNLVSGTITSAMTGTTSTSLIAAPGTGLRNYITQVTVSNSHATVGTDIILQDGSGGTTLYVIPAAAAYGGATISFNPPLKQPTAATALYCANVTTGSSTKVSASGFKA